MTFRGISFPFQNVQFYNFQLDSWGQVTISWGCKFLLAYFMSVNSSTTATAFWVLCNSSTDTEHEMVPDELFDDLLELPDGPAPVGLIVAGNSRGFSKAFEDEWVKRMTHVTFLSPRHVSLTMMLSLRPDLILVDRSAYETLVPPRLELLIEAAPLVLTGNWQALLGFDEGGGELVPVGW